MLVGLLFTACGSDDRLESPRDAGGSTGTLVDASGRTLSVTEPARRVVSLVPSATATLRSIGADSLLVARTDYDVEPWISGLPSVGGGLQPNLEVLVGLQPDLVIRFAGEQDTATPARLDDFGIRHLAIRPDRIEDIYRTTRLLGVITGHQREADALVERLKSGLEDIRSRAPLESRPTVAYVLGGSPPWVAGPGTYIDELISVAGGTNAFADLPPLYTAVSPEVLRVREIEVVLVTAEGTFDASLTPSARVEAIGDRMTLPGPGVVEAATFLRTILFPEHEQ